MQYVEYDTIIIGSSLCLLYLGYRRVYLCETHTTRGARRASDATDDCGATQAGHATRKAAS